MSTCQRTLRPRTFSALLLPGQVIDARYRVERPLAEGGLAAVYLARHRGGRLVILKVPHPEIAADPDLLRRFMQELDVGALLDHPDIIPTIDDLVLPDGRPVLVQPYFEGETLESLVARAGALPLRLAAAIVYRVARAVEAAHARRIVHRDIKPANVLVRLTPPAVRVIDWNIALLLDRPRHTELGMILATPDFAPCEQLLGLLHRIGPATDVWALAALFFFLATGGTVPDPFAPTPTSARLPGLPRAVSRVLEAALSPDETKRPSAAELAAALRSLSAA